MACTALSEGTELRFAWIGAVAAIAGSVVVEPVAVAQGFNSDLESLTAAGLSKKLQAAGLVIEDPAQWNIEYIAAPDDQVRACLYREKGRSRLAPSKWRAQVTPTEETPCQEFLTANLDTRTIHLDAPGYRPLDGEAWGGASVNCSAAAPKEGYSVCNSSFFVPFAAANPELRRLDRVALLAAISQSDLVADLTLKAEERKAMQAIEQHRAYERAFAAARTGADYEKFIKAYASKDPNGLVPLAHVKQTEAGRTELVTLKTAADIKSFISTYSRFNQSELVKDARDKLVVAEQKERKVEAQAALLRSIVFCKRTIAGAQRAIDREYEVAAISGVKSLSRLHKAGSQIVQCREAIPTLYARYREGGGTQPLASIE